MRQVSERPRPVNGLMYSRPPQRTFVRSKISPASWMERLFAAVITLGVVLSLLLGIALGLLLFYVSLELALAIVRLVREAVGR